MKRHVNQLFCSLLITLKLGAILLHSSIQSLLTAQLIRLKVYQDPACLSPVQAVHETPFYLAMRRLGCKWHFVMTFKSAVHLNIQRMALETPQQGFCLKDCLVQQSFIQQSFCLGLGTQK